MSPADHVRAVEREVRRAVLCIHDTSRILPSKAKKPQSCYEITPPARMASLKFEETLLSTMVFAAQCARFTPAQHGLWDKLSPKSMIITLMLFRTRLWRWHR